MFPHFLRLLALAAVCSAAAAEAGAPIIEDKTTTAVVEPVPLTTMRLRSSYVFESDFDRGSNASGDAWSNSVEVGRRFALNLPWSPSDGAWYLRLGAEYNRHDFSNSGGLPLPETLQSFAAVIALEYFIGQEVGILFETAPGFYFENDVRSEGFNAPTKLAAAYQVSERFFLVGGITYSSLRKYPFIPVVGFVWRVNDEWTVRALVPEPRVIYRAQENLAFWAGGELAGGSFRADDDRDRPDRLRNAALDYSEWRAGGGVTFGNPDRVAFELGGGYAFSRKFDYHRADDTYNTAEGAPYVKATFRASF